MDTQYRLIDDLGVFSVDPTYTHARCLELFRQRAGDDLYKFNEDITDEHFPHPVKFYSREVRSELRPIRIRDQE